jgi:peptidyl-dipeptidase Dcp
MCCNAISVRYGYTFHLLADVPLYHPDTSCYEVRSSDGAHVGLWYFDPYARAGKRSGAWMSEYRAQHAQESSTPIVSNNCNFTPPAPGECALLSWDDAVTLFHEFGHALHGLSSRVTYRVLAGTATTRDHVELPSQLNEHWLQTPELLQKYACHVTDGSPLPMELVKKIEAASTFAQGFGTVEFLASAIVDLRMHCAPGDLGGLTPLEFQSKVLADVQLPPQIVMRHATPHFAHVFGDDGYSAAYWSYLWADALVSDAVDAFKQAPGGMYDKDTAKRFFDCILSRGNTLDPAEGFRRFRGRDVDQHALLVKRGFA